jgi:hypothetical protein
LTGNRADENAVPLRVLNLRTDEAADHVQQENVGARVRAGSWDAFAQSKRIEGFARRARI